MKNKIYQIKNDLFYRQIFRLVLPIIIQNLLSAAVSSADVVMLNYVGQSSISAVSLASQYASVLFMVFYGLGTGATMLCAQYYGKGDMLAIQVVEGIAMRFSIIISFLFAGLALALDFLSSAPVYLLGLTHKCVMPSNIKDQLGYLQVAYV